MTFPLTLIFIWLVFWRPQEWLFPWMFGWPILDFIVFPAILGLLMEISMKVTEIPKTPAMMLAIGLWFATILSHVSHLYLQGVLDTYLETFKISLLLILLLVVIKNIDRARAVVLIVVFVFVSGSVILLPADS